MYRLSGLALIYLVANLFYIIVNAMIAGSKMNMQGNWVYLLHASGICIFTIKNTSFQFSSFYQLKFVSLQIEYSC